MNLTDIVLIYTNQDGNTYEQPLSDIQYSGTLIHPDTGDDLELTRWRFATGHDFVIVDGGLVQNDPAIPVFDLDVLDSDHVDGIAVGEAIDLYERLRGHESIQTDWPAALKSAELFMEGYGSETDLEIYRELKTPAASAASVA